MRNNNDLFLRLSYDTYSRHFTLAEVNWTSNTLERTVQISDILVGPDYRFGDKNWRVMIAFLPGMNCMSFPPPPMMVSRSL